jgi:ATP-dependent 26S proteasome regulatory subunit
MQTVPQPLNPMQLEILHLFSRDMSVEEMQDIKRLIVRYFAQKAVAQANQVWDEKGWTAADEERLLQLHERTPYTR